MKLYKKCSLNHIPSRLHESGRKMSGRFYLNEEVYRRCPTHQIDVPFATITLSDISLNRQGKPNKKPISYSQDVLLNCISCNPTHANESIVILKIKRLLKDKTFNKKIHNGTDTLQIKLLHTPITCNYSHTVFELKLNETIITFDNYDKTLGKKVHKKLRADCRLEIAKMIIRREIR